LAYFADALFDPDQAAGGRMGFSLPAGIGNMCLSIPGTSHGRGRHHPHVEVCDSKTPGDDNVGKADIRYQPNINHSGHNSSNAPML
jgi:hypothetical protein